MNRVWKPVKVRGVDFTGLYEVSNFGEIRRLPTRSFGNRNYLKERNIKQTLDKKGYLTVNLNKDGVRYTRIFVHRIVAEAFIPNPDNLPQVGHKDDLPLKTNNCVDNLYWTTNKENSNTNGRRARLSVSHSGENSFNARKVVCEGVVYCSMTECANHYGTFVQNICAWLNGREKMPDIWKERGLARIE